MNEQITCGESQSKMTSLRRCDSLPCKLRSIQTVDVNGKHNEQDKKSRVKVAARDNEHLNYEQIVKKWTALRLDIDKINFNRKTENSHVANALYDKSVIKVNSVSNSRYDKSSVKTNCKRFNAKRRVVEIEAKVNYNDLNDSTRSAIINQTFSPLESFQVVRERNADGGGIKAYTCQCNCVLEKRDKKYPTKASKSSRSLLKNWTLWSKSQNVMTPDTNMNNDVRSNEVNLSNSKVKCPYKKASDNENHTLIEQVNGSNKVEKFAERGRSKSLGYMQTKNVHQFRRCNSAAAAVGGVAALRERAALTLARRYYPEGGWGWTITAVGTCVQTLAHGLQLGGAPIARAAVQKFRCTPMQSHGEYCYVILDMN